LAHNVVQRKRPQLIATTADIRKQQYACSDGNIFITRTMTESIEILTAKLGVFDQDNVNADTRWNFEAVYHCSRDISTSGLGGHVAISGCQSLSKSFMNTVFELAIVETLRFVVGKKRFSH